MDLGAAACYWRPPILKRRWKPGRKEKEEEIVAGVAQIVAAAGAARTSAATLDLSTVDCGSQRRLRALRKKGILEVSS
jgi:hypothetical protein